MQGIVVKVYLALVLIRKTSFGEISGKKTKRLKQLESLFRKTKIFIRVFVGGCGNRKLK